MATERDVVVSAFATPPGRRVSGFDVRAIAQPFGAFFEEPVLVDVPATREPGEGFYDAAFARAAERYRQPDGSILARLFASQLRGVRVRRICLVGFSAGVVFLSKVLAGPDRALVDGVVALDGLHLQKAWSGAPDFAPSSIGPWANFGVRAARAEAEGDGPLLVVAHTRVASPHDLVGSAAESARALSAQILPNAPGAPRTGYDPGLLLGGPPPPAVTLSPSTGLPPPEKTFAAVPEPTGVGVGNYHALDFGGKTAADHALVGWFVQGGIWRAFLAPRWNRGLDCPAPLAAFGQAEFCGPQGVVVPEGVYPVPEATPWPWAGLGLAAGIAAGWIASRL